AHMPKLFGGTNAKADAEAIAAYLDSLKTGGEGAMPPLKPEVRAASALKGAESPDAQPPIKKTLFEKLYCAACHTPPNSVEAEAILPRRRTSHSRTGSAARSRRSWPRTAVR